MTLSFPTRLHHRPGSRPADQSRGAAFPPPSTQAAPAQFVLMVDFISPEGRTWWAVGVGDTLAEAIAFAQDSCPTDTTWQPVRWNDLYGD